MDEASGLRERKRRQTRQRIIDAGMLLFQQKGVEATTLDEIAAAADISRRTFFSYFAAKEDIALAWQDGAEEALFAAVTAAAPGRTPLGAVQQAIRSLAPLFVTHDFMEIDRILQSTPTLKAKKEQHFDHQSAALAVTLQQLWPDPARQRGLQVVATAAIGCLKVGVAAWLAEHGKRPVTDYIDEAFTALRAEIGA